jgi:hypothetical protein
VIALLVSFVLLVLGGVFITVIARNILNVQQARERLRADYFAESGLQFAIDQLVRSEFGADWRPDPRQHHQRLKTPTTSGSSPTTLPTARAASRASTCRTGAR